MEKISRAKKGLSINPNDLLRKRAQGLQINENHRPIYQKNMNFDSPDLEKFVNASHYEKQQLLKQVAKENEKALDFIRKERSKAELNALNSSQEKQNTNE